MRSHSTADPRSRSKLVGAGIFVAAVYLAYLTGQWVLSGTISALALRIGDVVAIALALAVLVRWRLGILLFLVWLILEDLARKYMGNNMMLYFIKDALIAVVYGAYMVAVARGQEKLFRPGFWLALLAFFSLALAQVFNPRSTSLYYGVLGMKLYFYYVPLMFLGYSLLRTEEDLDRFLMFNLKISVLVAGIGIVQALGWKDFLNPATLAPQLQELGHLMRWAPGMTQVLSAPPSVFVSQGRYANYLELMFTLALATVAFRMLRGRPTRAAYLGLGVLGIATFLSGTKGALVYAIVTLVGLAAALVWEGRRQRWLARRVGKFVRRGLLAVGMGMCAVIFLFPNLTSAWGNYYYALLWPDSAYSELGSRVGSYPMSEFEKAMSYADWTTGYGTGTASLGVQYVTELLKEPPPAASGVENGYGDLVVEMGILGPILWLLLGTALGISAWRRVKELAATPYYPVGLGIFWFVLWVMLPFTWGSLTVYQNYVVNAYMWTLVGVLFRLPTLVAANPARMMVAPIAMTRPAEPVRVG